MKSISMKSSLFFALLFAMFNSFSQETENEEVQWYHGDLEDQQVVGISLDKAYEFLQKTGRKPKEIVVAIVDSGIDTAHVDLQSTLWRNPGEIPGNGIDDDKNGYIDDVYGWNFLGNNKGENVNGDTWELTRYYSILKRKYENKTKKDISKNQKAEYQTWLEVKEEYENEKNQKLEEVDILNKMLKVYDAVIEILTDEFQKSDFTQEEVSNLEPSSDRAAEAKRIFLNYEAKGLERSDLASWYKNSKSELDTKLNPLFNDREKMGDKLDSMQDSIYGNNDVKAETSGHGTSVAGVVGADRTNNEGVKGIADNVKLMAVRVVPGGDERDKDVAMGIRYAVNNGAKIINGSFGKDFSPNKEFVDAAVKYAESKGVLIVHASGNDAKNIDLGKNYPTKFFLEEGQQAKNWIEVGASSTEYSETLIANFSNYGQKSVDIFAPGVDINTTNPENKYGESDGTSLASPVVTGVAALVWSYYPELTVFELKKIIEDSSVKFKSQKVRIINSKGKLQMIEFGKLSVTGGVVNAYEAVKMADEYVKNKK